MAPRPRATFPNRLYDVEANTGRGWFRAGSAEAPNGITAIAKVKGQLAAVIAKAEWRAAVAT